MLPKAKLTRIDSGGVDEDGGLQEVIFDSMTQLGRLDQCVATSPGCTEAMLQRADVAVEIEDPKCMISRNHALVFPLQQHGHQFWVQDLGSKNGTFVNEQRLPDGKYTYLDDGDRISLASRAVFEFSELLRTSAFNHALMVGHDGGNLRGIPNDIKGLRSAIEPRGFNGNIDVLMNAEATRGSVLKALEACKRKTTDDSTFLFYFSGHGSRKGELMLGRKGILGRQSIEANQLMKSLNGYRGKILLILDGCYTDAVAEAGLPANSTMIGHTTKAYEAPMTRLYPSDQTGVVRPVRGYTTRAIIDVLKEQPHRISVDQIVDELRRDPRIFLRQKIGYRKRTRIVLGTCQANDFQKCANDSG